jgi:hypothetical protein
VPPTCGGEHWEETGLPRGCLGPTLRTQTLTACVVAPSRRYDSWTGVNGKQTASEAQAQVNQEEAALSPNQKAQLKKQLDEQKKHGRHMLQGPKTQAQIQQIQAIDKGV